MLGCFGLYAAGWCQSKVIKWRHKRQQSRNDCPGWKAGEVNRTGWPWPETCWISFRTKTVIERCSVEINGCKWILLTWSQSRKTLWDSSALFEWGWDGVIQASVQVKQVSRQLQWQMMKQTGCHFLYCNYYSIASSMFSQRRNFQLVFKCGFQNSDK